MNIFKKLDVAVFENSEIKYPDEAPYNPPQDYPEYPLRGKGYLCEDNKVYESVRRSFKLLKLDEENYGTKDWNPLRNLISPGEKVVIKPNFVLDVHANKADLYSIISSTTSRTVGVLDAHANEADLYSIITHPSVIRAIVDYCYVALEGKGEIIIADSPQVNCNFDNLLNKTKLKSISSFYKDELGFDIGIYDLRPYCWGKNSLDIIRLNGDPLGYVSVNLNGDSELVGVRNFKRFYSIGPGRNEAMKYHNDKRHKYLVSKTLLNADCIIFVPKLKVHRKVGVTLNIKGLVGIIGDKRCVPHFRVGSPKSGGDGFPDILDTKERIILNAKITLNDFFAKKGVRYLGFPVRLLFKFLRKLVKTFIIKVFHTKPSLIERARGGSPLIQPFYITTFGNIDKRKAQFEGGSWHGNDTAWRMVVDLSKIIFFSDIGGNMNIKPQRKIFSLVDGIVGGEDNGPLIPTPKHCGVILAGFNPVAVDIVAIRLMGFDFKRIKIYRSILDSNKWTVLSNTEVGRICIRSNKQAYISSLKNKTDRFWNFKPPKGWRGYIEI